MKHFLKRIVLVAMLCLPWVMNAQNHYNLQIGAGTATSQYVPSYGFYNYSYSQSLYTAAEVGLDGTIDALSFQVAQNTLTRTITIYMAEVSQSNLSSAVAASEFHQVFSGSVNFTPGWVNIPLDTVFDYQDTGSLVIAVIDGTGTYNSSRPSFYGTDMGETRAKYDYDDYDQFTLSSNLPSSMNFLPNIILGITSYSTYCAAPSDVTVSDINNDEATISWTENGTATAYELVVSDTAISNTELANASSITVYDTSYTVSNLAGNTMYYVYVRAVCDASSSSSWASVASFRSACVGYTSIPYSTSFEDLSTSAMPNCWVQVTAGNSGSGAFPSAYVWQPNSRTGNVYFEFESNSGQTEIAALPAMENLNTLMMTFYASCMNTNFVLEAGVMEGDVFVPVQTVQLTPGSGNNWSGSYYPYTVYYGSYNGSGERMALRVTSSGSYTLMIDDLTVDNMPTCPEPTNFVLDSVGVDWAAISWSENGSATSWLIEYDTVDFVPGSASNATTQTVQSNAVTLSGLDSGMTYHVYVSSDCGGEYSTEVSLTFSTLAGAPANIPYSCDFEQPGVNGWEIINGTQTNHWMVGNGANNGGSRSLYITNDDATNAYSNNSTSYVYAIRNINISDVGEFVYSYDWRNQGESHSYDFIRVFLAPASAEFTAGSVLGGSNYSFATYSIPSTWVDLSGISGSPKTLALSSTWQTVTGTFNLATPGTYKLVFAWANDGSSGSNPPAAIDNVQLIRNTCPAPVNLTVTGVTATDISLEWQSIGDETAWEVFDGTNSYLANDTSYTLTGLTPDHNYNIRVRAICDVDDTSMSISTTVRTLQSCIRPVTITVDSVLGDTVWVSWTDTTFASSFDLVFGYSGFDPDTAYDNVITNVTDANYMFTGLTMGQRYDFYVRVDCGNEQSSWVGPASAVPSYQYTMAASGYDTIHVCGYTIYDNGGENGNYSSSCNSTLVVFPNDPTMTVQVSGTGYVESSYDHLYIYDGVGTNGALLYYGQGSFTMPVMSSESGAITIVFTSDGSVQYWGYELNVTCVPLPSCPHPTQIAVSNIGTQTADISWTELGSASTWIIQYDTVDFTPGNNTTANSIMVTANPYTLSGLDSGMTYYVYVASYCNPDTTSFVGLTFTTLAATPANLPYSCDFEQPGVNGWDLFNGTQVNHWIVGSDANNGGTRGLYITQNSTTNSYDVSNASTVFASRTIYFDSVGEYAYSFDWKAEGETSFDYLRAALVPTTVALSAGSLGSWGTTSLPGGAIALDGGNQLNISSSWTNQNGTFNINTVGAYNLVFLWRNDAVLGNQPPAAIDNVMISRLSCPSPSNLAVTRLTSDSVYLSWSGNGTSGPWLLSYDNTSSIEYNTSAAIGGLTSGTQYTFSVATLCGNDTSFTVSINATPGTWTMRPNQTDTLYMCGGVIYDDGGANGQYSSSQDSYIILRPDTPNNLVSVSGTSYTEGSWDYLTIFDGIGTSGNVLWSDNGVSSTQTFGPVESTNGPLTIYFHSDGSVTYDGFAINVSCVSTSCRVMNLALNANVSESSSQLAITWDAVTGAQHYEIEYGVAGFGHGQGQLMTSNTNSAVITGLYPLTSYDVYVRSLCMGGDTGSWSYINLRTAMCDSPMMLYNYDTTQSATTSNSTPVGYSYYNYSYVQTIIPAQRLAGLTGDVTAMAFNTEYTNGGSEFNNITVWMSNVSEDRFTDYYIMADATHTFHKVIDSADFSYSTTGWQIHNLDTAFSWDGVSNILVSVLRENGSWSSGSSFTAHSDTVARVCYDYNDNYTYDPANAPGGTMSSTVGDLLLISCGGGCIRPSGLHATDVTYGAAALHWTGSASSYEVAVKAATEGTWPAEVAVNASSYNVTGLIANTQYQFRVRSVCDAAEGLVSDWVVASFTTDELPCFAPENLHTTVTGTTTMTMAWTAASNQDLWSIHVFNSSFDTSYVASANPFNVGGLAANTGYYAAVKALCGGGAAESEYSDTIQFTTGSCPQVTGVAVTGITAHTATVSWNSLDVSKYRLEYGDYNFSEGTGTTVIVENATSYNITGLEEDYDYSVFVKAICEDGVEGNWSTRVDFITSDGDGVSTVDGTMSLSIYPNPASDATTIAVSGVSGEVEITIVDMNGRVVKSESIDCEGDCTKRVEVSGLAQGAYFVRVSGEGFNQVKKLVVK